MSSLQGKGLQKKRKWATCHGYGYGYMDNDIGREEVLSVFLEETEIFISKEADRQFGIENGKDRNVQLVFAKDVNMDNNEFTLEVSQAAVAPKRKW